MQLQLQQNPRGYFRSICNNLAKGAAGGCFSVSNLGDMEGNSLLDNSMTMVFNQLLSGSMLLLPFFLSAAVSQHIYWQDNPDLVKEFDNSNTLVVLMGGTIDLVCKVEQVSLDGEFKWFIAGEVAANHKETVLSRRNVEIRSELKLTNVTLDMNEKTVKCPYSELLGD